jgi:hypothetical protein
LKFGVVFVNLPQIVFASGCRRLPEMPVGQLQTRVSSKGGFEILADVLADCDHLGIIFGFSRCSRRAVFLPIGQSPQQMQPAARIPLDFAQQFQCRIVTAGKAARQPERRNVPENRLPDLRTDGFRFSILENLGRLLDDDPGRIAVIRPRGVENAGGFEQQSRIRPAQLT